ncbi:YndM family protein [Geobacillus stearothermophilus]|uniref:YndM family protein n=1 Tax=Geobacillus stearothermophilus TaxID=1422 RepID=UPI003D24B837
MKHIVPFIVKLAAWSVVLFSMFTIFNVPLSLISLMTVITVLVSYVIGDVFILPRVGHFVAAALDVPLSFLLIWPSSFALIAPSVNVAYGAFFSALAIGAVEAFFHLYMESHVLEEARREEEHRWYDEGRWATEFAEEEEFKKEDDRT